MSVAIISCGSINNGDDNKCFNSEAKRLNGKCTSIELKASPNDASDNRMLKVYYSIIPSTNKIPTKHPVALLVGGPGFSNTIENDKYIALLPEFLRERDIIIMDYRGTGFSDPYPRCDNLFSAIGLDVDLFGKCAKGLKEKNIKLGDYTSANIAYDFNKILEKEKIDKVVLLGYSYGTRVATTIARDYPNKVSSMILDGFFPIEANGISQAKESILEKLNDLAIKYDKKYPTAKLRDRLEITATQLDAPNALYTFQYLSEWAYTSDGVAEMKKALDNHTQYLPSITIREIDPKYNYKASSDIMSIAILMHEEAYFINKQPSFNFGFGEKLVKSLESFHSGSALNISSINKIKSHFTKVPDDKEMTALSSDIPTIIFTGGMDYRTPKYWALNAQKTLKNSMHFFFPAEQHVLTIGNKVSHTLMDNFLNKDGFRNSDGNLTGKGYMQIKP